jgi:SAM-dependent methyltransferase
MSFFTHWDIRYLMGKTPWQKGEPPKELVELVEGGKIKPGRALDLGCGTGVLARYLASKGFEVLGVDISKIAIIRARVGSLGFPNKPSFKAVDLHRLFPEEPFDLVTDVGCYHAQPKDLRVRYPILLKERFLKDGGDFLLWCRASNGEELEDGPNPIEREELEDHFVKGGFHLVELRILKGGRWPKFFVWFI